MTGYIICEGLSRTDRMSSRRPYRTTRRVRTLVWVGYWIVLSILTHIPAMGRVKLPVGSDKVVHFVLFFMLTLLGGWRYRSTPSAKSNGLFVWGGVYIVYAGLDEWLQQFVGRDTSLNDFWANLAGICMATLTLFLLGRRTALSDRSPDA